MTKFNAIPPTNRHDISQNTLKFWPIFEFQFLRNVGGYLSPAGSALVSVSHSLAIVKFWRGSASERCLLYTSPSPRDGLLSRMPSSA